MPKKKTTIIQRLALSVALVFFTVVTFSGCEVFVDFGLKNSTFELYDSQLEGATINMLTILMPGYQEGNPGYRYIVNYYDNDRCTGEYYAADTLNYMVEGTWSLPEPDVLRIDLDAFVDGDFKITKLDQNTYLLDTDANRHGLDFFDTPTLPLKLYNRKIN